MWRGLLLTVSLPGYRGHVDLPNPVGATASVSAVVVSDVVHRHVGGVDTLMITVVKSHAMYFGTREKTTANNYDESADVGTVSQCRMLGSAGRGAAKKLPRRQCAQLGGVWQEIGSHWTASSGQTLRGWRGKPVRLP